MKNERSERPLSGAGKASPAGFDARRQRPGARQERELPTAATDAAQPEGTAIRRQRPNARQEHELPTAAANAAQSEGTEDQRQRTPRRDDPQYVVPPRRQRYFPVARCRRTRRIRQSAVCALRSASAA